MRSRVLPVSRSKRAIGCPVSEDSEADPKVGYGSAHDLPSFVEMRQQLKAMKALTLVVMRDKRAEFAELERQLIEMADRVDAFYELLGPRHWTYNDAIGTATVDAILDETSTPEEAEQRLIEMYQSAEAMKWNLMRLRNIDGLRERQHLLVRARDDYDAGRFDSCTLILISVMDGFVNDFETDRRKGLAAREANEMVAWDSVTGHHMGLTNALKPFLQTIKNTDTSRRTPTGRGVDHGQRATRLSITAIWSSAHTTAAEPRSPSPEW